MTCVRVHHHDGDSERRDRDRDQPEAEPELGGRGQSQSSQWHRPRTLPEWQPLKQEVECWIEGCSCAPSRMSVIFWSVNTLPAKHCSCDGVGGAHWHKLRIVWNTGCRMPTRNKIDQTINVPLRIDLE